MLITAYSEWKTTEISTWPALKALLTDQFIPNQHILDIESAIHNPLQGKRRVAEYITWFQGLRRQLIHLGRPNGDGATAIGMFLRGLSNTGLVVNVKATISTRKNITLSEVINMARELASIYETYGAHLASGNDVGEKDKPGKPCVHCKRPGHLSEVCWTLPANAAKKPNWLKEKERRGVEGNGGGAGPGGVGAIGEDPFAAFTSSLLTKATYSTEFNEHDAWIIDTGASVHMSHRREWFHSYEELQSPAAIGSRSGNTIYALGKATIMFVTLEKSPLIFNNVLYVPNIAHNLFSVSAVPSDVILTITSTSCEFLHSNGTVALPGIRSSNGLFVLDGKGIVTVETPHFALSSICAVGNEVVVGDGKEGKEVPVGTVVGEELKVKAKEPTESVNKAKVHKKKSKSVQAYVQIPKESGAGKKDAKRSPQAVRRLFLGYPPNIKGYPDDKNKNSQLTNVQSKVMVKAKVQALTAIDEIESIVSNPATVDEARKSKAWPYWEQTKRVLRYIQQYASYGSG